MFRRSASNGDDRGVALLSVLGSMIVLSLFLLVGVSYAMRNMTQSREGQDSENATAAAQAGVDDFLQQMNLDYFGNVAIGNWSAYRDIQGAGITDAQYRYKVLSSLNGQVLIQVDGVSSAGGGSGSATKVHSTVNALFQSRGFLSYVYLSDIEVIDPTLVGDNAACGVYYYSGRSSRNDCSEIQWTTGDVVNGPLHSNDALQINGTVQFKSTATTSWPTAQGRTGLTNASKTWWGTTSAPLPNSNPPLYDTPLELPVSNSKLLTYVEPDVDGDITTPVGPGCYYTGATRIIMQGTTMKVLSPSTTRSDTPSRCYNRSTPGVEQTVTIPPVIYVDSTTASCSIRNTGYPLSSESYSLGSDTATSWGKSPNYSCKRGTAYIQGTADARVTVAAADDVVITGNLTVQDISNSSTDVVGIIAGNYAWVYHPLNNGNNILTASSLTGSNPPAQQVNTIQAGMLALRHSFLVQNWDDGNPLGTLNITGSIAQKFRGPVGTGSGASVVSGYLKNYDYDDRLAYLRPPYFLEPPTTNVWTLIKTVGS
jgi:Tfp pilus assembly protein PilV